MGKKQAPVWVSVAIERNGEQYRGEYSVEGRGVLAMIAVRWRGHQKRTQLGTTPAESLARVLLGELVREYGDPQ